MPIREVMEALDSDDVAARAQRAVLRLEQALAAVSSAAVGHNSSGGVQVDSEPGADSVTGAASVESAQPARAVARFEDVMRIAPSRPAIAPTPPAAPPPAAAQTPAAPQARAVPQAPAAPQTSAAPRRPTPPEAPAAPVVRREVIRLDLSPAPVEEVKPLVVEKVEEAPVPVPAPAPMPAPAPAAPLPPAAAFAPFWFECMPTPPVRRESVAPPVRESVPPPASKLEPEPLRDGRPRTDTSRRTWVAALCLLLLAGLAVVVKRHAPRR